MRKLAYYSQKDGTFHKKTYNFDEEAQCKHDFAILERSAVPFFYSAHYNIYGAGGTEMKSYGLGFGKSIPLNLVPENIRELINKELEEDDDGDYGGKREFGYNVYESENWYGLYVDCGEDDFENEVEFYMFITKDGKSVVYA